MQDLTEPLHIGAVECANAHTQLAYSFYQGLIDNNIKINQTKYFSDVIKGIVNRNGDYSGETFRREKYERDNV